MDWRTLTAESRSYAREADPRGSVEGLVTAGMIR